MPFDKIGVFDLRYWDRNMPEHADVPDMATDALCMNGCESSTDNVDIMSRAAAGLLEGHSHEMLSRKIEATEAIDDNWHRGMLDCRGATILSMVTTAYERASKEMRDAFIYQIEQNTAKCNLPRGEDRAVPGDILAEAIFKFIEVTLQLKPKAPFEDLDQQVMNRRQAGIRLEHVGCMVAK